MVQRDTLLTRAERSTSCTSARETQVHPTRILHTFADQNPSTIRAYSRMYIKKKNRDRENKNAKGKRKRDGIITADECVSFDQLVDKLKNQKGRCYYNTVEFQCDTEAISIGNVVWNDWTILLATNTRTQCSFVSSESYSIKVRVKNTSKHNIGQNKHFYHTFHFSFVHTVHFNESWDWGRRHLDFPMGRTRREESRKLGRAPLFCSIELERTRPESAECTAKTETTQRP